MGREGFFIQSEREVGAERDGGIVSIHTVLSHSLTHTRTPKQANNHIYREDKNQGKTVNYEITKVWASGGSLSVWVCVCLSLSFFYKLVGFMKPSYPSYPPLSFSLNTFFLLIVLSSFFYPFFCFLFSFPFFLCV